MGPERRDSIATTVVAGLIALAIGVGATTARRRVPAVAGAREAAALSGDASRFTFFPPAGRLHVRSTDGTTRVDLELSVLVDGAERPVAMRNEDVRSRSGGFVAAFPLQVGEETLRATLELTVDTATDHLRAKLTTEPRLAPDRLQLRVALTRTSETIFVPSHGELAGGASVKAPTLVFDDGVHPLAILSGEGDAVAIDQPAPSGPAAESATRLTITTVPALSEATTPRAPIELGVLLGPSSERIWERVYRALRVPVGRVVGTVSGTRERSRVIGLDDEGHPLVRTIVGPGARFSLLAPISATHWYASVDATSASAPVRFSPGAGWELRLDVSPGGELQVRVRDGDAHAPLTARLWIHGIDGTPEPTFGPDYRASGAGPLMDLARGEVSTALPAGRYRVSATKGLEWSIDAQTVEIVGGKSRSVDLELRHVVTTPGLVGCDLHVHARPSFDTPVTPEDRVLSLVSAGVDFAVPTEHNIVGDYGPALEVTGLTGTLGWVPGVEVTTFKPNFGHFGVFPYPLRKGVPSFKGTSPGSLFAQGHRGDPSRVVQVNHPRLPNGIGYFSLMGWDAKTPGRIPPKVRLGFDTLEVFNGYDIEAPARIDAVMRDWYTLLDVGKRVAATGSSDSHRIQYHWAGYPRTYAALEPSQAGDTGQEIDTQALVAAIKAGRSFVTNGPILDFEVEGAHPGGEIGASAGRRRGHLRVMAAPWIDVTSVEIVTVGGRVAWRTDVTSRPSQLGRVDGPLEAASGKTVRFDADLALDLPPEARWVIAIARGTRSMSDVLAFMTMQPLAFTNPIWIGR